MIRLKERLVVGVLKDNAHIRMAQYPSVGLLNQETSSTGLQSSAVDEYEAQSGNCINDIGYFGNPRGQRPIKHGFDRNVMHDVGPQTSIQAVKSGEALNL